MSAPLPLNWGFGKYCYSNCPQCKSKQVRGHLGVGPTNCPACNHYLVDPTLNNPPPYEDRCTQKSPYTPLPSTTHGDEDKNKNKNKTPWQDLRQVYHDFGSSDPKFATTKPSRLVGRIRRWSLS